MDACTSFVSGVAIGCKESVCALIGGETAEMPSLYKIGDFDAAGCAIGALAQERELLPITSAMRASDKILGLASSGCHSNGFRFVMKQIEIRTSLTGMQSYTQDHSDVRTFLFTTSPMGNRYE